MKQMVTKILALTLAVALLSAMAVPALAEGEGTVRFYLGLSQYNGTTLPTGEIYLSSIENGDLSDPDYCSTIFPPSVNAKLNVTGALKPNAWPTLAAGMVNGDGYPVDVIQRGTNFDGCPKGYVAYQQDSVWAYSCTAYANSAVLLGEYYIYSIGYLDVPLTDINSSTISISDELEAPEGAYTVQHEDLSVIFTNNGRTIKINSFELTDAQIDLSAEMIDNEVTVRIFGIDFTYQIGSKAPTTDKKSHGTVVWYQNNQPIEKAKATEVPVNPETGRSSTANVTAAVAIVSLAALAIRKKK